MENWINLFDNKSVCFKTMTKTLLTKGNLVYEYNPLRNYRLSKTMYEYKGNLYSLGELYDNFKITVSIPANIFIQRTMNTYNIYEYKIVDEWDSYCIQDNISLGIYISEAYSNNRYKEIDNIETFFKTNKDKFNKWFGVPTYESDPVLHEKGELTDFVTSELKVDLNHPVLMIPQYSYDGSVNLIINDGINIPKLINTRFSATGKNTYEIIDRKGNNDSNIYDLGDNFESDVSLYKNIQSIPNIKFEGTIPGGSLAIGNYHFYFKLADADGNESDFIGESGLVSVFIGQGFYNSVNSGLKNQNSFKSVKFILDNIDSSYDYVMVYYSRHTAEQNYNSVVEYYKINKKFLIQNSNICNIIIDGSEYKIPVDISDINVLYNVVDAAKTSAVCQNMLFLGNVHKYDIPYKELTDLSLRFLPYLKQEKYDVNLTETYEITGSTKGYIDSKFIYEKTGYWEGELYRLGIVYILPNGQLSPVFNIRGAIDVTLESEGKKYTNYPVWNNDGSRNYITYNEQTNYLITDNNNADTYFKFENNKGVIKLLSNSRSDDQINSLDIKVDVDTMNELKKYVKGYFFVRQPRIPLVLSQGITIGIDQTAKTPTLPVSASSLEGFGSEAEQDVLDINGKPVTGLANTYVETEIGADDINYISEGFISRYKFEFKEDESLPLAAKVGLIALAVVAIAAATIFTFGAAAGVIGAVAGAATAATVASTAVAAGATALATGVTGAIMAGVAGAALVTTTAVALGEHAAINIDYLSDENKQKLKLNGILTEIPKGFKLSEMDQSRLLTDDYQERLIIEPVSINKVQGIICPDYTINQAFYNQIYIGNKHLIKSAKYQNNNNYFLMYDRHFYISNADYGFPSNIKQGEFNIIGVPENTKAIGLQDLIFRSRAGEAEEAWRFEKVGNLYPNAKEEFNIELNNSDIIRGIFSSYLAINDNTNAFNPAEIVNIYIPEYDEAKIELYISMRMNDANSYHAITDRYSIQDVINEHNSKIFSNVNLADYSFSAYRGDCYICLFTQRLFRNFNDPSAPYNDKIVNPKSWKEHYIPNNTEEFSNINLGDVNAVPLGMWVTFKLRSSNNLNIRTLDGSDVSEAASSGHERGYYPYYPMSVEGSYKIPDSQVYNKGFSKNLSSRWNTISPDVPYIKNWFGTRVMYSDIQVNDAFKNGYRVFKDINYRDYTREYGEIVKLIPFESKLLIVFEHGIGITPVNVAAIKQAGNVLSNDLIIISDVIGSLWHDSILKVPSRFGNNKLYVYGVDTVAKKIWRTDGSKLQCMSDMKVQEFLNNNITLGERELTPKLGIRNVKTVYNSFKQDVLFTFYDNTYGFEEKVWNLCWNELLEQFVTFYSWVPSFMENINNIPFSFNRDVSKWIAKLGTSHTQSSFADGITLSNVIINNESIEQNGTLGIIVDNYNYSYTYINKFGNKVTKNQDIKLQDRRGFIGVLSLNTNLLPNSELFYLIKYSLEPDNYLNNKLFTIYKIEDLTLPDDAKFSGKSIPIYGLYLNPDDQGNRKPLLLHSELYYRNKEKHAYADDIKNRLEYEKQIAVDKDNKPLLLMRDTLSLPIFKDLTGKRLMLPREQLLNPDKIVRLLNIKATIQFETNNTSNSKSDVYYNMQAGFAPGSTLINGGTYESTVAVITKWNMQFLSTDFWKHGQAGIIDIADDIYPTQWYGKQHPFEFECVVSGDPGVHKIFTNLELIANKAKPESFHYEIIGEAYDFAKDKKNMYFRQEAIKSLWAYNGGDISYNRNFLKIQPEYQVKSADFPHTYYSRQDTINEIEDYYVGILIPGYDYRHLSGSEIVYYPNRQEYRIWTHARAVNLNDLPQDESRSIIAANCQYLEDRWKITINPMLVCYKNESEWSKPCLPIMNSPIPTKTYDQIKSNNGKVKLSDELLELGYKDDSDFDMTSWITDDSLKELSIKDKFIKIRIRYSGEELAIINFLKTIYTVSYT